MDVCLHREGTCGAHKGSEAVKLQKKSPLVDLDSCPFKIKLPGRQQSADISHLMTYKRSFYPS